MPILRVYLMAAATYLMPAAAAAATSYEVTPTVSYRSNSTFNFWALVSDHLHGKSYNCVTTFANNTLSQKCYDYTAHMNSQLTPSANIQTKFQGAYNYVQENTFISGAWQINYSTGDLQFCVVPQPSPSYGLPPQFCILVTYVGSAPQ